MKQLTAIVKENASNMYVVVGEAGWDHISGVKPEVPCMGHLQKLTLDMLRGPAGREQVTVQNCDTTHMIMIQWMEMTSVMQRTL